MFNKDVFRLLHSEKFPIVNPDDALCTIIAINIAKPIHYPHSVVAHLLGLSCRTIDASILKQIVITCANLGWRPYRDDASHYEKLCINKIVAIIDNYEKKNN